MKKHIFITGAGRGIGREIAIRLAKEGFEVSGCARSLTELEETKKLASNAIRISRVDVTNESQVADWIQSELSQTKAKPWGLVTAAGIHGSITPFFEDSISAWKEGVEVNLIGTATAVMYFSKYLISKSLEGRVVLLSGGGATQPIPNLSSYCASKAAVVRFGETVAEELRGKKITVNAVAPGAVNTAITETIIKAGPDKAGKVLFEKTKQQLEKGGTAPDKATALVSYLLSDAAANVTGKLISAVWDDWSNFSKVDFSNSDIFTLRRITLNERTEFHQKSGLKNL